MGWSWVLSLAQPGPTHATQRRMVRKAIGPQRVGSHDPLVESEISKLLKSLTKFQGNLIEMIQRYEMCCFKFDLNLTPKNSRIGGFISQAAYGERIWDEMGEDLSHWNFDAAENVIDASFSFWSVNVFHFRE
jgi:hypothetical protein